MKPGHTFLSDVSRVRHVSDTDTGMARIGKMCNSKGIFLGL